MYTIKFRRFGNGVLISHTDVLRCLNRTMRRANIGMNFSKGFNKHMTLKLTQPLPLGIASDDEYVVCDLVDELSKEEFLQRVKDNLPPFLSAERVFYTEKNPSLSARVNASAYYVRTGKAFEKKDEIENIKNGYKVTVEKKGETAVKEVADMIYEVRAERDSINFTLAFGNPNLRIDVLFKQLNKDFDLDIGYLDVVRTEQLIYDGSTFLSAEKYMESVE